jgi:dolichol-phosphate mannosyltransferase
VVVPAYNEEAGIEECVTAVEHALAGLPNRSTLIVVEDGSADRTAEKLERLAQEHAELNVVFHPGNRGYGAALRTGTFAAAERGFDYVLFMDSDLTNDPRYLPAFVDWMQRDVDVIKASRYSPGGGVQGVPPWRVALSEAGNAVARALYRLPVRDATNGFRAVKTELLTRIELNENGFAVIMEELYRLEPIAQSYGEVPIVLTNRPAHLRGTSFDYGLRTLGRYLKYPVLSALDRLGARRIHGGRA